MEDTTVVFQGYHPEPSSRGNGAMIVAKVNPKPGLKQICSLLIQSETYLLNEVFSKSTQQNANWAFLPTFIHENRKKLNNVLPTQGLFSISMNMGVL